MSLATICGVTVLRSLIISILGVFLSCHLSKLSDINNPKRSFRLFILVLAPLLVPDLIVGYTWSLISLKLVHYPFLLELVYSGLLLMKVVPVGIICFCFMAPPAISPEADFIRKSVGSSSAQITGVASRGSFFLWKNVMRAFPVGALLFLLSFQEFEMAALLGRATWTVSVFDAHAGGVPVIDSISFLQGPLLVELIVISGAVLLLQRTKNQPRIKQRSSETGESYRSQVLSWLYLLVAFLLIVLIPFSLTGWGGVISLQSLLENRLQLTGTLRECGWGLLFGITAAIAAWGLAAFFFSQQRSRKWKVVGFMCCLPGLCGSLSLALLVATLFLTESGQWLYETPFALFVAFVLFLFPRAAFLKWIFRTQRDRDSLFLARLLSHSHNQFQARQGGYLNWELQGKMQYAAVVILAFWAYWDVTISSILAPNSTMTSAVRLYGLMHYRQSSLLSAVTFISLCIPVIAGLLLFPVVKKMWIYTADRSNMTKPI